MRTLLPLALLVPVGCGDRDDLESRLAATESRLDDALSALEDTRAELDSLQDQVEGCATVSWVQEQGFSSEPGVPFLRDYVTVDPAADAIVFSGANVYVQSGSGSTNDGGTLRGLGNLVIGYAESSSSDDHDGSHNLVVGAQHSWTGYGGIVAGFDNTLTGAYAAVLGGTSNEAIGDTSVVVAGSDNTTTELAAAVVGGTNNLASGYYATVSGGYDNAASGTRSAVGGGVYNTASGDWASVAGGQSNSATGNCSAVSGGLGNVASGFCASVLGGKDNAASSWYTTVYGSLEQTADSEYAYLP